MKIQMEMEVDLTPEQLGELWANLNDDAQARFFVSAAKIIDSWENPIINQMHAVGRHLVDCTCSTEGAREIILNIVDGMKYESSKDTPTDKAISPN